ncbi:MAG: hypothetical protein KDB21_07455 [Acidimicrobiales bacterium]|nr:hypothetical protein [Acidimicrobiales bacterium]
MTDQFPEGSPDLVLRFGDRILSFCLTRLPPDLARAATEETFARAHERLDHLADPNQLRAWLYAIARNAVVDQIRLHDPAVHIDPGDDLTRPAAAPLFWETAASLQEREQEVLDLHVRHGLDGDELAAATGAERRHCDVLLVRLHSHIERTLGSLLLARHGRRDCAALDLALAGWDGVYDPRTRSTVTAHADGCAACTARRSALTMAPNFPGSLPLTEAPPSLADTPRPIVDTWRWRSDGFPESSGTPNTPAGIGLSEVEPGENPEVARRLHTPLVPLTPIGAEPDDTASRSPAVTTRTGGLGRRIGIGLALFATLAIVLGVGWAVLAGDDSSDGDTRADETAATPDPTAMSTEATPTVGAAATGADAQSTAEAAASPTLEPTPEPTVDDGTVTVTAVLFQPVVVSAATGADCDPVTSEVTLAVAGAPLSGRITWTLADAEGEAPLEPVADQPNRWSGTIGPFAGPGEAVVTVELTSADGSPVTVANRLIVERC